ncbi:MAG: hypothetical protein DVB31_13640 [Verrucomicrobia bacterium]|nr:MAG: hypothetical protein DVB31_13640 [Verrucomicrobiota bacterium]
MGKVMQESVEAALGLVRSRCAELGIAADAFKDTDIHVHVPGGAVPKDHPSAGIAMLTALASLFTDTPVRKHVAMTGEITPRGLVLPIGGLKEKSPGALRAGIRQVILPKPNDKDLVEVPAEVKSRLKFVLVETVEEFLAAALEPRRKTQPIPMAPPSATPAPAQATAPNPHARDAPHSPTRGEWTPRPCRNLMLSDPPAAVPTAFASGSHEHPKEFPVRFQGTGPRPGPSSGTHRGQTPVGRHDPRSQGPAKVGLAPPHAARLAGTTPGTAPRGLGGGPTTARGPQPESC